jgi:hypothetical protein
MVTELVGYTIDDLGIALEVMELETPVGGYSQIQLCTESPPGPDALEQVYQSILASGHTISYPTTAMVDNVAVTTFNLRRDVPIETYFWPLIIPLIVPVLTLGLITFGIVKIDTISTSLGKLVVPILLIGGGIVIVALALARKPATAYIERGGKIPYLPSVIPNPDLLPATSPKTEFQQARAMWDRAPRLAREGILKHISWYPSEAILEWREFDLTRKYDLLEYFKEKHPENFTGLEPPKKSGKITTNPPTPVLKDGLLYYIHNTFSTSQEANEEASTLRSEGSPSKTLVQPWEGGYVVYEHPLIYNEAQKRWLPSTRPIYVEILSSGETDLVPGSLATLDEVEKQNKKMASLKLPGATYQVGPTHRPIDYDKVWPGGIEMQSKVKPIKDFTDEELARITGVDELRDKKLAADLHKSIQEEVKAQEVYAARAANAEDVGDKETADLYKEVAGDEAQHMKEFKERLEDKKKNRPNYIPDSQEFMAQTIQESGWKEKLDQAFQAAIKRVRG